MGVHRSSSSTALGRPSCVRSTTSLEDDALPGPASASSAVPLKPLRWPEPRAPNGPPAETVAQYVDMFARRNPEHLSRARPRIQRQLIMGRHPRLTGFVREPQLVTMEPRIQ